MQFLFVFVHPLVCLLMCLSIYCFCLAIITPYVPFHRVFRRSLVGTDTWHHVPHDCSMSRRSDNSCCPHTNDTLSKEKRAPWTSTQLYNSTQFKRTEKITRNNTSHGLLCYAWWQRRVYRPYALRMVQEITSHGHSCYTWLEDRVRTFEKQQVVHGYW